MSGAGRRKYGHHVSFREALLVWLRIAALSFGGPAGQIAVMHRILVEEKKWISDSRFLGDFLPGRVVPVDHRCRSAGRPARQPTQSPEVRGHGSAST